MRTETVLWASVACYFAAIATLYGAVGGEPAGVVVLGAAAAFGGLVAGWSWRWTRNHPVRPSDRDQADVAEAAGSVGVYPGASVRPLGIAAGFTWMLLGLPLGSWLTVAGLGLLTSQIALLVRDQDR